MEEEEIVKSAQVISAALRIVLGLGAIAFAAWGIHYLLRW
jgi:hypothetical protein